MRRGGASGRGAPPRRHGPQNESSNTTHTMIRSWIFHLRPLSRVAVPRIQPTPTSECRGRPGLCAPAGTSATATPATKLSHNQRHHGSIRSNPRILVLSCRDGMNERTPLRIRYRQESAKVYPAASSNGLLVRDSGTGLSTCEPRALCIANWAAFLPKQSPTLLVAPRIHSCSQAVT